MIKGYLAKLIDLNDEVYKEYYGIYDSYAECIYSIQGTSIKHLGGIYSDNLEILYKFLYRTILALEDIHDTDSEHIYDTDIIENIFKEKSCIEDDYIRLNRLLLKVDSAVYRLSNETLYVQGSPEYLQRAIGRFLGEFHDVDIREVYASPQALYNEKIYRVSEPEECDELPFA